MYPRGNVPAKYFFDPLAGKATHGQPTRRGVAADLGNETRQWGEELREMIERADSNGDGAISAEAFGLGASAEQTPRRHPPQEIQLF